MAKKTTKAASDSDKLLERVLGVLTGTSQESLDELRPLIEQHLDVEPAGEES